MIDEKDVLLQIKGVSKQFPGVVALDNMNLSVKRGTVHALIGENGAGKSTLMKILSGLFQGEGGEIIFDNEPLKTCVNEVLKQGISMIYQELNPVDAMTVAENIFCGKEPRKSIKFILDRKRMIENSIQILDELNIDALRPRERVCDLSIAQKQLLEVAKAFANRSKLIILDEPTSALSENECHRLFAIINKMKAKGATFIYITHKMEEIFEIADEVTIIRDGKYIDTRDVDKVTRGEMVRMMVGRELTDVYPKENLQLGETMIEIENLSVEGLLHDVSFAARRGEVLGIAGLMGAGRSETMEAIFGIRKHTGKVKINGKEVKIDRPIQAIKNRIAFITEDRRETGCFQDMDVYNNLVVISWKNFMKYYGLSHAEGRQACNEQMKKFAIKSAGLGQAMRNLSGGNQQKVLLARWLLPGPEIIIMDSPTRGIDVGAKYEIYSDIVKLAKAGKCIIMVSSEMPELLGMSDRIVVMHEGRVSGILDREQADQETILEYAAGLTCVNES